MTHSTAHGNLAFRRLVRPGLRLAELVLLITMFAAGSVALATVALVETGTLTRQSFQLFTTFALAVVVLHVILTLMARDADQLILPLAALLTTIGLIAVQRFSFEPALGDIRRELPERQLAWSLIGLAIATATVLIPQTLRALRLYRYVWLLTGLALVVLTLVVGEDVTGTGTRLWLGFGRWRFQPSEVLKVLMVAFLASYLDERRELLAGSSLRVGPLRLPPLPYLLPLLIVWGLSLAVLVLQEDLGAAVLFFALFLGMLYLATGRIGYVLLGLALFMTGSVLVYRTFGHVQMRIDVWLNPWADPAGRGYQAIQALLALAAGGIMGVGLGYGHPGYIPAVHTDLVFAALGEEIGVAGLLVIMAVYAILVARGFHIALHSADSFNALLAAGLSLALGLQTALIIGGTLRVLPLTGITLPFISYGGSSLVTNYLIVGLLLRISMERQA